MFGVLLALAASTVYFEERFDDDDWEQRWVYSRHRPSKGDGIMGTFRLTSGAYYGNQRAARGIQTMDDSGWYQFSSKLKNPLSTRGKDFVLQYTVRFENGYECSGGYIKLLGSEMRPIKFNEKTPYLLMFGPDVCKPNQHKVMFLVNHNGTNHDIKQYVEAMHDELTHAYTLIIRANRTYEIRLDGEKVVGGDLDTDFELGGTEMIADPEDEMPEDWDNRETIPDPEDFKPEDWDERPIIPDPTAVEPPEWRAHIHGKWEPPMVQNPDYKGTWKPRQIPNPRYRGEWVPKLIPNPVFIRDENFGVFDDVSYVGIEVFQVKAGSIFDNILITDDIKYAEDTLREVFLQYRDDEFAMYRRVLQDRAADEELRKLRDRENQEMTDEEFYSSSYSSGESSETTESEDSAHFIFPSEEISDAPTVEDFVFPYKVDSNPYFLAKKKMEMRKSSSRLRQEWAKHRDEKRDGMEWPEHVAL